MRNGLWMRGLVIVIIMIFLGTSISSSIIITNNNIKITNNKSNRIVDWYENFNDGNIADWTIQNPYGSGNNPITLGLSTAQSHSPSYSMIISSPNANSYSGAAWGPTLAVNLTKPYTVEFWFRYTSFHWHNLVIFGHIRALLDKSYIPMTFFDNLGQHRIGPNINTYLSPDTWAHFKFVVIPSSSSITLIVNGNTIGSFTYSITTPNACQFYFYDSGGVVPEPDYISNGYYDDIHVNQPNQPPIFGTPSPTNSSTGQPVSLPWSIPINDPEGNTFSWTIQCSNGQTNSGSGATNGTKTLTLSGLAYSNTYRVWVNATDPTPGSNNYTRKWYTFTTKTNQPPVFGTPSPTNLSVNNPPNLIWSIPINDPEGNLFIWSIQCSNGQTNSGTGATNGTKTASLSNLSFGTTYKIWVNATDPSGSGQYIRRWYTFMTKINLPPVLGTPSPANGSTGNPLNLSWSIPINDPDGDQFSWTIQCNNGQTNGGSGATNGTQTLTLTGLFHSTTYKVWVNATDPTGSTRFTRHWFTFSTQENQAPGAPTITGPSKGKINVETTYNFTATDPNTDDVRYYIEWGDGTNSGWIGPYASGETIAKSHTWITKGTYTIKAKAKDTAGMESSYGQLSVTMPFSYTPSLMQYMMKMLARFPHAFPILRHLMGY